MFDNEIDKVLALRPGAGAAAAAPGKLEPGGLAEVETGGKEYLGRAFVNPASKITARLYSPSKEGVDKGFFKRRLREALERRLFAGLVPGRDSFRLAFAEADFLPGLIIDLFSGWPLEKVPPGRPLGFAATEEAAGPARLYFSVQFLCAGVDARRELILDALAEVFAPPAGVIERTAPVRELEGLPLREGVLRGEVPERVVIFENGLPFAVSLAGGQKTGHFLDQRENRAAAARWAALAGAPPPYPCWGAEGPPVPPLLDFAGGALPPLQNPDTGGSGRALGPPSGGLGGQRPPSSALNQCCPEDGVLDAFCCTGGFAIHLCRLAGARVTCVDSSASALEALQVNAALNGVSGRVETREADVFEFLREAERGKQRYRLIVLDPPAFAKTRSALPGALRGYREINLRALKMLPRGGVLVTCSCSQALEEGLFRRTLTEAARDAEKRLQELEFRSAPPDHPALLGYPESRYLKCGVYRVV